MINNENIFYEGEEKGIILLHSFTSGPQDFSSIARFLVREGYSVYTPAFSGHGKNTNLDNLLEFSYEDWKKDIEEALDFMEQKGFKKVTVFGLSLGGKIGFNSIMNDDRVIAGGIFSAPILTGNMFGIKKFYNEWYANQMDQLGQEKKSVETINNRLEEMLIPVDNVSQENLLHIKEFTKPLFIAQGGDDEIIDAEDAIRFKNELYKTQIHFHWYDKAPHVITVGKISLKLRNDLLAFLNTIEY